MPVTATWTDPSTSAVDLITGQTLDQQHWENVCSDLYYLGGASGRITQATSGDNTASTISTTSTGYVDLDPASTDLAITTSGGDVLVFFAGSFYSNTSSDAFFLAVALDGAAEQGELIVGLPSAGSSIEGAGSLVYRYPAPAAGSHTFRMRWRGSNAASTYSCTRRHLLLLELKR